MTTMTAPVVPPIIPVPSRVRSPEDAEACLARIGQLDLALQGLQAGLEQTVSQAQAALNDVVTKAQGQTEAAATPLLQEIEALVQKLNAWAAAKRVELTRDGQVKSCKFRAGTLAWRQQPATVVIADEEAVLRDLDRLKLEQFKRCRDTVNRKAMQDNLELARTVPGVAIVDGAEQFIVSAAASKVKHQVVAA